jgi:hypothetical protein
MILSCLSGGLLNCSTVLTSPKSTHPAVGRYKIPNRRHLSLTRKPITIRFSSINRHQLVTPPSANSPKSSRHKDLPELRVKPRTDITRDLDGPTKIAISNDEFEWIGGQDLRFFFRYGTGQTARGQSRRKEPVTTYLHPVYHKVYRRTRRDLYAKIEGLFTA